MIIVEGSDHVGKTMFCKSLVDALKTSGVSNTYYEHMSKPSDDFDYFGGYLSRLCPGVVYDRFHFGAYVYGAMLQLHPVNKWSLTKMHLVSRFIEINNGLIIVLYDSDVKAYEERLRIDGKEEMFSLQNILLANELFRTIPGIRVRADWIVDIRGGKNWPSESYIAVVVEKWCRKNGYQ